jgi:methylmalonyl-CoA mutase C-terminal domain/subunit
MTSIDMISEAAGAAPTPLRGKRILIGKPGLDGHDIGAKIVALALRNAGAEVIYTGLRKRPEQIVRVAIDEGVDAVGLSILSGSHRELAQQVIEGLREAGAADVHVFVGGTIPADDHDWLRGIGVQGVYDNDMPLSEVIESLAGVLS